MYFTTPPLSSAVGEPGHSWDLRLEHAGRVLGASPLRLLGEVTLPLLRPSILAAGLLVFLFDFTSFGVVLLLGGPQYATLEVEIYIQALHMLNLPLAGLLSAIQLACTLILTVLYTRLSRRQVIPHAPPEGEGARSPRSWKDKVVVLVVALALGPFAGSSNDCTGSPLGNQVEADRGERGEVKTGFTLDYYRELFINRRQSLFYVPPIQAAVNSLGYAGVTVLISLIGIPGLPMPCPDHRG